MQRPGQGGEGDQREQPPGVDAGHVDQDRGDREARDHEGGDMPVIPDDEVVPEHAEVPEPLHDPMTSDAGAGAALPAAADRALSQKMHAAATTATTGTRTSRAASLPGQETPAPSAPQKVPNEVSMTPTANFIQFSGTFVSGPLTAMPVMTTTTIAAIAPMLAASTLCWLSPKVMTMKTTSSPSSSTPLKASVKEYQSVTRPRDSRVASWAALTSLR